MTTKRTQKSKESTDIISTGTSQEKNMNEIFRMVSGKEKYRKVQEILKPFCRKDLSKAITQVSVAFCSMMALVISSFFLYDINPWLTLLVAPLITAFLCRSFVIVHDCGHQSLFQSRKINSAVGNIFGIFSAIPYHMWQFIHDSHHANVGNLDKRDLNPDLWTMTVREYESAGPVKRAVYRHIRSRISRLVFAPLVLPALFRIPNPKQNRKAMISVIGYDIFYAVTLYFLLQIMSPFKLLVIYGLPLYLFWVIASYVLYAQHQFEDTYWEKQENWSYEEATLQGATYLTSPKWFAWMSGNVGYHNIHHLIAAIPNYNLAKAQLAIDEVIRFKPISIFSIYGLLDYKLWDEEEKKLVPFPVKRSR
jgi:omega-6 fatty acid desaturase (delta-12 desaturase)